MGCFRNSHHFSCLGVIDTAFVTLITVMLALWIGFAADRDGCSTTKMFSPGTDVVVGEIRCNASYNNYKVTAAGSAFIAILFVYFAVGLLLTCAAPYNFYVVRHAVHHCDTCKCPQHVAIPGTVDLRDRVVQQQQQPQQQRV